MGPIGVVGASARAAVGSLARAGFAAWAVDLFADRDLRRVAPCARCPLDRYPDAIPELCDGFPLGPVLYTGGLENDPHIVRELERRRPLWGNGPSVLERVRDPFKVGKVLVPRGITETPITNRPAVAPAGRGVWKPFRSSGGLGVRFAIPGELAREGMYFQEYIDGPSMSAQFITSAGQTVLFGITEQLVGESWLHARPFAYCGNIGPVVVSSELRSILLQVGSAVADWSHLRGVWGVDVVLRDGWPYLVDVNPRYTAGLEVLEHGCGFAALTDHATAFAISPLPAEPPPRPRQTVGKAVYYAPHRITFPTAGPWDADLAAPFDPWHLSEFADLPDPGTAINDGSPVLTIFARGSTPDDCRGRLQSRAAELDRLFSSAGATA